MNLNVVGNLGGTGPAWGYHGYEYGLALGNLLQDIAGEEAAWESRHYAGKGPALIAAFGLRLPAGEDGFWRWLLPTRP